MSDTPRTDAINTYIRTRNDYTKTDHEVWREHARTLETELAAAKKRIADCEFVMAHRYDIIERQEPRCNEANARAEKAEAELVQLRAENESSCKVLRQDAEHNAARAEKAEAELASEREKVRMLTNNLRDLITAVTYADPPKLFGDVLCHEARVPVGFVDSSREALATTKESCK